MVWRCVLSCRWRSRSCQNRPCRGAAQQIVRNGQQCLENSYTTFIGSPKQRRRSPKQFVRSQNCNHTCQAPASGQDDESTKVESTFRAVVACADRRLGFCIFSIGLGGRRSTRTSRIGPQCPGKPYCDLQSTSELCSSRCIGSLECCSSLRCKIQRTRVSDNGSSSANDLSEEGCLEITSMQKPCYRCNI